VDFFHLQTQQTDYLFCLINGLRDCIALGYHAHKECQQVLETTITPSIARLQLKKFHHCKQSRVLSRTTMIEWLLGVFDHLFVLCRFTITVLIIIAMSLDIAYHLLYVMH
jgi:hypothetical protein